MADPVEHGHHADAQVDHAKKADEQPKVSVKPTGSYLDSETGAHKNPEDPPYEVSRQRAAELRANGLVEYASEGDEHAAIEAQVKAAADQRRADIEARKPKGPKLSPEDDAKAKAPPAGSHPPLKIS